VIGQYMMVARIVNVAGLQPEALAAIVAQKSRLTTAAAEEVAR
jgi:hypothetical protein